VMTAARLERRLRDTLEFSRVVWRKPTKTSLAMVQTENGHTTVYIPPDQDDDYTLRYFIHELSHVALHAELGAFGTMEEEIIERVIEPHMMAYMVRSRRKHEWWLRRIRKLREAK